VALKRLASAVRFRPRPPFGWYLLNDRPAHAVLEFPEPLLLVLPKAKFDVHIEGVPDEEEQETPREHIAKTVRELMADNGTKKIQ
jgi:hypothetical protein